jgi:hypothetical protein
VNPFPQNFNPLRQYFEPGNLYPTREPRWDEEVFVDNVRQPHCFEYSLAGGFALCYVVNDDGTRRRDWGDQPLVRRLEGAISIKRDSPDWRDDRRRRRRR